MQLKKMKELSEEQIAHNVFRFYELIDKYLEEPRKHEVKKFYMSIELTLATSPASSKISHHNCFPGGYLDHVIRVTEAALVLNNVWDKFGQKKDYTVDELVFCAINHDLGKLGTNDNPFYVPNTESWQIEKQGVYYKYNTEIPHMRIADRSLFCLQKAGIAVNEKEFLAIKLHDGLYEESNKSYYITYNTDYEIKSNLPYILHQADLMASRVETQIN
jgi:hypothetical protein